MSEPLQVALKEWATVCHALQTGRQTILLRKGGIYEAAGEFEVEHRRFVLFPTYLHQNPAMLKPEAHAGFTPRAGEPDQVELQSWAEVSEIVPLSSRQQMDALDEQHIWASPLIDMRFNYRPENPLYLLIVRTHLLASPIRIDNAIAYAGCKSWVPLEQPVEPQPARAVMPEEDFSQRRMHIMKALGMV
jgi:hypothetical protein